MKALVYHGPKDVRYQHFDDPRIADDRNLIIRVQRCSICGSDLHIYHGTALGSRLDYSKQVQHFCTGHEAIGEVVEVGAAVRNHGVGDRIMVAGAVGCGACRRCRMGQFHRCESFRPSSQIVAYGLTAQLNGCHAEYLEVQRADLTSVRIPDGVSDEQAVLLTDALATGYTGVKRAQVAPGQTVAVIGQGPVGLMAAEAAVAIGASRVYAIDPVASRRDRARAFGASPLHPDRALAQIREDTKGVGVDAVIEAVGHEATVKLAVQMACYGGQVSVMGILQPGVAVPMHLAQMKSVSIHAGLAGIVDTWAELIPLVQSGRIKGADVYTHNLPLSEGAAAYRIFDSREEGVLKVMLAP